MGLAYSYTYYHSKAIQIYQFLHILFGSFSFQYSTLCLGISFLSVYSLFSFVWHMWCHKSNYCNVAYSFLFLHLLLQIPSKHNSNVFMSIILLTSPQTCQPRSVLVHTAVDWISSYFNTFLNYPNHRFSLENTLPHKSLDWFLVHRLATILGNVLDMIFLHQYASYRHILHCI